MRFSRLTGLLPTVLLLPLLTACLPTGGYVGAVATGHFSAGHQFPVLVVAWCGDAGPQQIDLVGGGHEIHLVATRGFDGNQLEVDLAAPGDGWRITDGRGEQVYRLVPESEQEEYRVGVGSRKAEPGEETEHDIGTIVFATEALTAEQGVYSRAASSADAEYVPQEEFPPEC